MNKIKLFFLGAGEIAIPVLRSLAAAPEIDLCGVATQPDRPAGRKNRLIPSPLGAYADSCGIAAERVENVNAPDFIARLRSLAPEMILVVSFGQLLKQELLDLPLYGCLNLHASLLPRYRGASPIVQCILNLDDETGVDLMQMEAGLDSGPVYHTWHYPLKHNEYADALELALGELASVDLAGVLGQVAAGKLVPVEQDPDQVTVCRKIKKSDGVIDWNLPARKIDAMVRAYTPWPGAVCRVLTSRGEQQLTLQKITVLPDAPASCPGTFLDFGRKRLVVSCLDGAIEIETLQPSGGKPMTGAAYLNGNRGELPQMILDQKGL